MFNGKNFHKYKSCFSILYQDNMSVHNLKKNKPGLGIKTATVVYTIISVSEHGGFCSVNVMSKVIIIWNDNL